MRNRAIAIAAASVVCGLATLVPPASASFHLVQVREIYPGSAAAPAAEYVELQAWSSGQDFVAGHFVRTYNASGEAVATSTFPADVARGEDQMTMVLATPEAEAAFGIVADAPLTPAGQLSPTGGAVCWEAIDCVAWGNFAGSLPSPAGPPAAASGIPDGMALRRTVGRACPTALDPEDDSDNSAADFAAVFPLPRPNSTAPTERACVTTGGGSTGSGGSSQSSGTPQTILRRKPPKRTADHTPTFRFAADEARVRFQCKVDATAYRACRSPFTTKRLALGLHRFKVRAIDSDGRVDPSPASYRFRVIRKPG